jgi:hypothetical protein
MASEHISISVVGTNIGSYQDLAMMQQIASLGKGRFYLANNPNVIPQILLKETQQAARRAIVEEPFIPAIVGAHPILTGLAPLPQLEGYVATTPKTAAQLVLISQEDDPVLAVWQYGLGRVAAWTSDALGLWTANWLRWSEAPRWWANLVTWTLPTPDSQLIVNGEIANGSGHVTVDLPPGTQIGAASQQQVQVKIIAPDLSQQTLTLQPTAPGRWEGNFPTAQVGAYLLRVTWQARNGNNATSQLTTTTGLVVPYSPEYLNTGTDLRFLKLLAQAGGGSMLGPNDTAAAFSANLEPVYAALLITFWLFALAALLLPIDIALRRLSSLEFLVVCYHWLAIHLGLHKAALATEGTATRDATDNLVLSNLRSRREEWRSRFSTSKPKVSADEKSKRSSSADQVQSTKQETLPATKSDKSPMKQPEASLTGKLLEAKRNRGKTKSSP